MSAQEIIQIANELSARGITPSTAMVKARLSHPVPMAELLKVLSQWKQQPQPAATAPARGAAHNHRHGNPLPRAPRPGLVWRG